MLHSPYHVFYTPYQLLNIHFTRYCILTIPCIVNTPYQVLFIHFTRYCILIIPCIAYTPYQVLYTHHTHTTQVTRIRRVRPAYEVQNPPTRQSSIKPASVSNWSITRLQSARQNYTTRNGEGGNKFGPCRSHSRCRAKKKMFKKKNQIT